ncbi:MAG: SDR family oxidoreductase [candidate division Zixibacteria bacterium]|nr:SDR family oxidoreductase [candidate division Zixibacteria bacterium]
MHFLITGGAGFIGSNIAHKLLETGRKVRILDNFSSGKEANLADIKNDIELIRGDIRDIDTVRKAVEGIDFVYHQAALASVQASIDNPLESHEINLTGTLNMLEQARQAGVKKFIMASSAAVYGDSPVLPKHEKMLPEPLSPYAVHKLTGEYYLRLYWQLYKFPTVALRYFNVFGPRQDPKSDYAAVIPCFIDRMVRSKAPTVFGDGEQTRDFIYIDNCVAANLLAAENEDMVGEVFNVAGGDQFTLNQLLEELRTITGKNIKAVYEPARPGDIRYSYASIDKIKKVGFKPRVGFSEGLKNTVEYFAG